jgi:transcriptional antiterminator RfaH
LHSELPASGASSAGSALNWYLLQCKPRQDARAVENLLRQGYACYRPLLQREKLVAGRVHKVEESLFPGYLFIRLDAQDNWAPLRSTRGVSRLVVFSGYPLPVPAGLIEQLRQRSQQIAAEPAVPVLKAGDKVRIADGPFAELEAIFHSMDGLQRAVLLLNMLNRQQKIHLPLGSLVKN